MAGDDFAELLRELKERSGLSYGALGKRLHMSASTLHRYVSGEVVPVEFAPVERLARVCRATPEELLELHRRWIRADALRGVKKAEGGAQAEPSEPAEASKTSGPSAPSEALTPSAPPEPVASAEAGEGAGTPEASEGREASRTARTGEAAQAPGAAASQPPATTGAPRTSATTGDSDASPGPVAPDTPAVSQAAPAGTPAGTHHPADAPVTVTDVPSGRTAPRRRGRRSALYAATGVAVVAGAMVLVANLVQGGGDEGWRAVTGATAAPSASVAGSVPRPAPPSGSVSASPSGSASASASPDPSGAASASASRGSTAAPGRRAPATGPALTVATNPYYWSVPCEHAFLIDRSPQNVLDPPVQQDAVGWATAYGAVSANRQTVVLTVQGTGEETVVLNDLHVRVVNSGPPLDWKQYVMGNGCGGGVDTKAFDVALDMGTPMALPVGGQRDFPYKVTESDPEVFHVRAHTSGHDVSWYLELEWSSGDRHGILRIDDHGKPFRTSASKDDSYYAYPLGSDAWELANEG
ncbi:helix-turn-helix domain-containing protein [Streptomyces sp. NPDC006367]|uniref:transcriptional regulator n=1 Tax=unclassified Streptomyces TaxID=2593676 RepID=UPI0033B8CD70